MEKKRNDVRNYDCLIEKFAEVVCLKNWEIPFSEVEEFFFTDITKQLIGIHYKEDVEAQKLENARTIGNTARKMNKMLVGAQEGIPTYRLSMKPQALLDLLNQRLEAYRSAQV